MAYKRQSPTPISEGGTNNTIMTNTNGTVVYDGTSLGTIDPGMAGEVLTSFGSAAQPQFQPLSGAGSSWIGSAPGADSQISSNVGGSDLWVTSINYIGAIQFTNPVSPRFVFPFACILSNLYVVVTANTSSASVTSTIYVNNSPTTITVGPIGAGVTGTFSDLTHTVMVAAGDTMILVSTQCGANAQRVNGSFTIQVTP